MNGHPRARINTILRQCEAPVKTFKSRWFPASNYRFKWSFIAGQGSTIKMLKKNQNFEFFFWSFISIQGVQGAIREVPEPIPELTNIKKSIFSINYIFLNSALRNFKFRNFLCRRGTFFSPNANLFLRKLKSLLYTNI